MSATPYSTLANSEQRIADLERQLAEREAELAECKAERDEALEQQTATAAVLQVINSSPGDLAPVFDAILEKAHTLCSAEYGGLATYDGEYFRLVAARGYPEDLVEALRRPFHGNFSHQQLLRGERYVHIEDVLALPEMTDVAGRATQEGGFRTVLMVPLRKDGTLLGHISASRQEVRPFTEKQIALLQNFAAQAVIAMENARLITETRGALEQQTATAEVLQVINSSPGDLAPVFDAILEKAHSLCGTASGSLHIADGDGFRAVAVRGVSGSFADVLRQPMRPGPNHPVWRAIAGELFVQIPNVSEIDDLRLQDGAKGGFRTVLLVPLRKEELFLGYIIASRREVRPFSDKQIALLQNFAAQAVIAMENARLINETREALEQQTATAEVLQVINSSPGDLAPVFEAIVEKALALCGAAYGGLGIFDGECFNAVAGRGHPEYHAWLRQQGPIRPAPGSTIARIVAGEDAVQITDIANDEVYRAGSPSRRALVEIGGFHTLLSMALRKDNTLLGMLQAYRQEVRPFSDKQIALLHNFAAQAVIAMENARLLTVTREALEQQTATTEVLQIINSSPGDLAPVFDTMLEKAMHLCEAAFGDLGVFDGKQYRWVAAHGIPDFAEYSFQLRPDGNAPLEQLTRGERLIHLADVRQSDFYRDSPAFRSNMDRRAVRSLLVVPLRKDGELLGAIRAYRQEVRPFSDKQIALLQNFAAQAVIAMENARLLTETREALEQQTATAEVLGVINSSPGDLAPVFDAMLEKALRLCDAAFGIINTYDGELFHPVAMRSPPALADTFRSAPNLPRASRHSGLRRIVLGEDVVQIEDLAADPVYQEGEARRVIEAAGAHSYLGVALRLEGKLLGTIGTYRQEVRPFSDKQIALLQNFAAQAVIAMENARLITETREALEQQTATAEVLQVINSSPGDLKPVFDAILEKAHSLCAAVHGALVVRDGDQFRAVATHGLPGQFAELLRQSFPSYPGAPYERLLQGERLIHIQDQAASEQTYPIGRASVEAGGRTLLFVPLRKDGTLLGYITAGRQEVRPFSDREIALLQNFAAQAVIAMENARLITETREALERQTATAEVLQVINSSPGDLTPVFDAMLEKATRLCEAGFGELDVYDGQHFRVAATLGAPAAFDEWQKRRPAAFGPGTAPARIVGGENLVHTVDLKTTEAYQRGDPMRRALVDLGGARTHLIVALRKDSALLGIIAVYRQEVRPFSEKQIALLQNFAAQAVIAMENARLLGELRQRTEEVSELNRGLESRVAEQVDELGRVGRLKRFLAPQLAELIVSQGDENILESHRREIVVVFCDLRGYTAFTETAEPEEVLDFLREYHGALGPLVSQFEGTLDQFSGDGIKVTRRLARSALPSAPAIPLSAPCATWPLGSVLRRRMARS